MREALRLAERGRGTTSPNPMVGAVVVSGGRVIGRGWHRAAGEPHAEAIALEDAGAAARGAVLYVTLEPCCHTGRTGPCTERIIEAGIARVSAAVSSTLDLDQVLQTIATSALEVVGCNRSAIFVLEEESDTLRLAASQGLSKTYVDKSQALPIEAGGRTHAVATRQPVLVEDITADPGLRRLAPLAEGEGVVAFADIPLRVGKQVIGMLSAFFTQPHRFTDVERGLLTSFADQAAIAIENARLYANTDRELRRQAEALSGLQVVAQEVSVTFDQEHILRIVLEEAMHLSRADHCAILLYDEPSDHWTMGFCAGYLEEEQAALRQRLSNLPDEDSFAEMCRTGKTLHLDDATEEGREVVGRSDVRSALLVPIRYGEQTAGAIVLGSRSVGCFDDVVRRFVETLAAQAAIAISNARRYQEQSDRNTLLRQRADQLSSVLEVSRAVRSDEPLEDVLEEIAYAIQESVGFDLVLVSMLEGDPPHLRRVAAAGVPLPVLEQMKQVLQPWKSLEVVIRDEFKISQSYYIPAEEQARWRDTLHTYEQENVETAREPGRWHPQDMLLTPLLGSGGEIQGILSVDDPREGQEPGYPTIEALEVFAAQAAAYIENARLLKALQGQLDALSVFNEINRSVAAKLDLDEVLRTVVGSAARLIDCQGSVIFLEEERTGQYVARRVPSAKFEEVYLLQDVYGRTLIEIHPGNTVDDTHGCIIVASSYGKLRNHNRAVLNSGDTFRMFMRFLEGYETIKVSIKTLW